MVAKSIKDEVPKYFTFPSYKFSGELRAESQTTFHRRADAGFLPLPAALTFGGGSQLSGRGKTSLWLAPAVTRPSQVLLDDL